MYYLLWNKLRNLGMDWYIIYRYFYIFKKYVGIWCDCKICVNIFVNVNKLIFKK